MAGSPRRAAGQIGPALRLAVSGERAQGRRRASRTRAGPRRRCRPRSRTRPATTSPRRSGRSGAARPCRAASSKSGHPIRAEPEMGVDRLGPGRSPAAGSWRSSPARGDEDDRQDQRHGTSDPRARCGDDRLGQRDEPDRGQDQARLAGDEPEALRAQGVLERPARLVEDRPWSRGRPTRRPGAGRLRVGEATSDRARRSGAGRPAGAGTAGRRRPR